MGRRSRKRVTSSPSPPAAGPAPVRAGTGAPPAPPARPARPASPRAATWRARMDDAPKAAWAPFPLTELCILVGIVLITLGFMTDGDRRGVMLAGGFTVVTLAAGELAVREHFAGFRSHSALLAAMCALLAAVPIYFLPVPQEIVLVVALVVGAVAFMQLRRAFTARSGGVGFRA